MIPREEAVKIAQKCHYLDKRLGVFCCPMCCEEDKPEVCCAYCTVYGTEECTDKNPCRFLRDKVTVS